MVQINFAQIKSCKPFTFQCKKQFLPDLNLFEYFYIQRSILHKQKVANRLPDLNLGEANEKGSNKVEKEQSSNESKYHTMQEDKHEQKEGKAHEEDAEKGHKKCTEKVHENVAEKVHEEDSEKSS